MKSITLILLLTFFSELISQIPLEHQKGVYSRYQSQHSCLNQNTSNFSESPFTEGKYSVLDAIIPDFQVNTGANSKIAVENNGDFSITWEPDYNRIYCKHYSSGGIPLGETFQVNTQVDSNSRVGSPEIASNSEGNYVIVWIGKRDSYEEGRTELGIYAQLYSNYDSPRGDNFQINTFNENTVAVLDPAIASDSDGNFVIVWEEHREFVEDEFKIYIFAQRFSNDGNPIGDYIQVKNVSDNNDLVNSPAIALDSDGNFAITWGGDAIYAQLYSNDGSPIGDNFQVNSVNENTYGVGYPDIASDSEGNFVIIWGEGRDMEGNTYKTCIFSQRFSKDGNPIGENIEVASADESSGYVGYPTIASDSEGNIIIAWNKNNSVYAQRFSKDGNSLGENFLVTSSSNDLELDDVKLCNGKIYITWTIYKDLPGRNDELSIWVNVLDWDTPVGIQSENIKEIPAAFKLLQNYPNPFNPITRIKYNIPVAVKSETLPTSRHEAKVTLIVYDILGREAATLVNQKQNPGNYEVEFDASNLTSGIYFYRLQAGDYVETKKMILLK